MNRFLFGIAVFMFVSLPAAAGPDLKQATKDTCKCLEAPYAQLEKAMEIISAAQTSGDMSQMMVAQGEMMGVLGASTQCFERLAQKYPEIDQSDELKQEVMDATEKECPKPASAMGMSP